MPHNGAGLNGTNTFAHDYPTMGTALRNSGRDIVYSCSWLVFAFNHSFTEYGNLRLFSVVQNSHKTLLAGDAQGLTALFETSRQIRVRAYLYVSLQSSCSLCCSLWGFILRPAYEGSNEILKPWAGIIQAGCNTWRNWHDISNNAASISGIINYFGDYSQL